MKAGELHLIFQSLSVFQHAFKEEPTVPPSPEPYVTWCSGKSRPSNRKFFSKKKGKTPGTESGSFLLDMVSSNREGKINPQFLFLINIYKKLQKTSYNSLLYKFVGG